MHTRVMIMDLLVDKGNSVFLVTIMYLWTASVEIVVID